MLWNLILNVIHDTRPRAIKLKRIVKMIIAKVHRKVYVKLKTKVNHKLQSNMVYIKWSICALVHFRLTFYVKRRTAIWMKIQLSEVRILKCESVLSFWMIFFFPFFSWMDLGGYNQNCFMRDERKVRMKSNEGDDRFFEGKEIMFLNLLILKKSWNLWFGSSNQQQ